MEASPGAQAIIHDKIVVVDPFSSNCAVITGSHNLGYRASYNNDENLLIITGNRALAIAYAAHVLDGYDYYHWRFKLKTDKANAWIWFVNNDSGQDEYFAEITMPRRSLTFGRRTTTDNYFQAK